MALDKPKRLELYPAKFHDVLLRGEGRWLLQTFDWEERDIAMREARRFRAFIKALRAYPGHPSAQVGNLLSLRTEVRQDPLTNGWDFKVIIEDRRGMLAMAERTLYGLS